MFILISLQISNRACYIANHRIGDKGGMVFEMEAYRLAGIAAQKIIGQRQVADEFKAGVVDDEVECG